MKSKLMVGAILAAALLAGGLAWQAGAALRKDEDKEGKKAKKADDPTEKPRPSGRAGKKSDEAAIRKQAQAFSDAFNKGDLDALAALWTADAEFVREDGKVISGRAAIRDMLEAGIKAFKGTKQRIRVRTIRFVRPEVATEEGSAVMVSPDGSVQSGPYLAVWVKQGGKWLLSSVRDLPGTDDTEEDKAASYPRLKPLAWLVGEWTNKKGDVTVSCKWAPNQSFIVQVFTVKQADGKVLTVSQQIGWDGPGEAVRSWIFDSQGGYSVGAWSREGNTWTVATEGSLPDGRVGTSTSTYKYLNDDSFTWTSRDRVVDEEPLPEVDVTFTRKKAEKP
jgi:uncharacterized protein (TIGR02246 family)